jgi:molybdate transport system regulatory protein
LKIGIQAFALIKASSTIIASDLDGARLSSRNQLPKTVRSVIPGMANTAVILEMDGGGELQRSWVIQVSIA